MIRDENNVPLAPEISRRSTGWLLLFAVSCVTSLLVWGSFHLYYGPKKVGTPVLANTHPWVNYWRETKNIWGQEGPPTSGSRPNLARWG